MKILILTLFLLTTTLFANIGKITAIKGDASVLRDSKSIPLNLGFILKQKDKITTGKNTRVQIIFKDNTIISLGKESSFDIGEYSFDDKDPSKAKMSFKVAKGIFKSITGKIGKINPSKFKLKTKSATIGIRGTTFFGDVPQQGPESIACTDGAITVSTAQGIVEVPAGQFTQVSIGSAPTPPASIPPAQTQALEQNSGANENENESGNIVPTPPQSNTPIPKPDEVEPDLEVVKEVVKKVEKKRKDTEKEEEEESKKGGIKKEVKEVLSGGNGKATTTIDGEEVELEFKDGKTKVTKDGEERVIDKDKPNFKDIVDVVKNNNQGNSGNSGGNGGNSGIPNKLNTKSASFTALQSSNLNESDRLVISADQTFSSFYEYSLSPSFYMSNGVVKGSNTLTKMLYVYSNSTYSKEGDSLYNLDSINLTNKAISSNYTGFSKIIDTEGKINLLGKDRNFFTYIFADSKQELFIVKTNSQFNISDYYGVTRTMDYENILVFGEVSSTLPIDGISRYVEPDYEGLYKNLKIKDIEIPYSSSINWKTKRIISYNLDNDDNDFLLYMGTINSDGTITHNNFYALKGNFSEKMTLVSDDKNKGYIFGSEHQGFGATVFVEDISNNNIMYSHGAYKHPNSSYEIKEAKTGSAVITGFTNYDKDNINKNITMTLNRDTGNIINGGIDSLKHSFGALDNSVSAYIDDDTFAAIGFNAFSGWLIAFDTRKPGFEDDDISWGLWAKQNETNVPQPWVAGENKVESLNTVIGSFANATYTGPAMGYINNTTFINPQNSTLSLNFDFGKNEIDSATLVANGSTFVSNMNMGNLSVNAVSYIAQNGDNSVNGSFYKGGDITAGTFKFINGSDTAHGVFKAKR